MRRTRFTLPLAAAAALVIAVAGPASATISVSGDEIASDAGNDNIVVLCNGGVLAAVGVGTTGDPCVGLTAISLTDSGGTDTVNLSAVTRAAFPALIASGVDTDDGQVDVVTGSPLTDQLEGDNGDVLNGGDGDDHLIGGGSVNGGPGDDSFFEFNGSATALGGDGDDRFVQILTLVGLDGGAGVDTFELDVDGVVIGSEVPTTWTMSPAGLTVSGTTPGPPQLLPMVNMERLYLTLMQSNTQTYDGSAWPGAADVRGLGGTDTLTGGSADDSLSGGAGNDTVTGGGGADRLRGGDGDDIIQARDGVADAVDCGGGTDTAVVDPIDQVVNCEIVQLPPPLPAAPVPSTGKVKGPDSVTKPAKAKFRFSSPTSGATFQCKLDKKKWKACGSPYKVKTKKLDVGKHKLQVRAVLNGVVDPTPSKKKFKVKAG